MTKQLYEKCPICNGNAFEGLFDCKTCNGRGFVKSTALQDVLQSLMDKTLDSIDHHHKMKVHQLNLLKSGEQFGDVLMGAREVVRHESQLMAFYHTMTELNECYKNCFGELYEPKSEESQ